MCWKTASAIFLPRFPACYVSSVRANSRTVANPSWILITTPHSFAKASNTGSHAVGGGSSSCGTACVSRFANVTRIAAAVFALSSLFPRMSNTISTRSLVRALAARQGVGVELFRKLQFAKASGGCSVTWLPSPCNQIPSRAFCGISGFERHGIWATAAPCPKAISPFDIK